MSNSSLNAKKVVTLDERFSFQHVILWAIERLIDWQVSFFWDQKKCHNEDSNIVLKGEVGTKGLQIDIETL